MSSEKTKIIERLESIRKYFKLTQVQFSLKLNISQGYYSGMMNKGTGISAKAIIALAIKYPEINLRWFLTGEGEMLEGARARLELGEEATRLTEAQASRPDMAHSLNETEKRIIEYIEGLPEKDQEDVLNVLQIMMRILKR